MQKDILLSIIFRLELNEFMSKENLSNIDKLWTRIQSRKRASPSESYTAQLLESGEKFCADKLLEETQEVCEAVKGKSKDDVTYESADLLYHLLVLWEALGISPDDVYNELTKRESTSGIKEKQWRSNV